MDENVRNAREERIDERIDKILRKGGYNRPPGGVYPVKPPPTPTPPAPGNGLSFRYRELVSAARNGVLAGGAADDR